MSTFFIFEQASAADEVFLLQRGQVSLFQKGMSKLLSSESKFEIPAPTGVSAESRPATLAITTVSVREGGGRIKEKEGERERGCVVCLCLCFLFCVCVCVYVCVSAESRPATLVSPRYLQ